MPKMNQIREEVRALEGHKHTNKHTSPNSFIERGGKSYIPHLTAPFVGGTYVPTYVVQVMSPKKSSTCTVSST